MKPNLICITKWKLLFERERERDIEKKEIDEIPFIQTCVAYFSSVLCCSLCLCLFFLFSLCLCCVCICSLLLYLPFFFFPPSSPFFACWRLFIYREVWETAPTFFRSSTDRLIGNIHGPLSFFTCSCHPSLFSLLVCFVSRIFFS